METIISSIITGAVAIIVCVLNNRKQQAELAKTHQESMELMAYKIDELSKKQDRHNSVIERTYALEQKATLYEEKFKVANKRIEDLEDHEVDIIKKLKGADNDV